uniref:RING-type domain-containing protein n=2 Tax=Meloidogyne TaxID=189290 RepID=A0A6V7VD12_MELEN|nr:unnamed protein product [Meloidogyne enterolobii]
MKPYGCALCLEPDNVHTITLKCHHKYHQNCITLWIDSGVPFCPQCRAPATLNDINPFI